MYVTASGGQVGGAAANSHIQLVSALGACGTLPASIVINELTSTAAAYALGGFAPTAGTSPVTFQGKSPGIDQAFVTLTNLITSSTGALATGRETNQSVVQQRLNTVANATAACDMSSGAAACAELFSCARVNAVFAVTGQPCTGGTGTTTTDTLNAALAVVQNAGLVSMAGIFDVASSATPFTPALTAAPLEWTLPLVFTIRNYGPLAIDAAGHVWLLAPDPRHTGGTIPNLAVTEIDADGTFLSPHQSGNDWSGGGVSSIQGNDVTNLAIDQTGNVWVSGTGSTIAELTSTGAGAPGAPWNAGTGPDDTAAVTIDSAGNAWFASANAQSSVFEFSQAGVNKSSGTGYGTANCPCNGMAADPAGNVWTVSSGTNQFLSRLDSTGLESIIFQPPAGFSLAQFFSVATDGSGTLWITDKHFHGVWQFTPSVSGGSYSAAPFPNHAASGTAPKGIAIDGASHKWVANNSSPFPSITELSADGTLNLSPSDGFGFQVNAGVSGAYGLAVDGSGNVWVSDGASNVTEYVGAAAPTKNPIVSAITAGSFVP
jgi:sugar lactone lactonase YvrE